MWRESSSVNTVNMEKKITTFPDILNFSQGITFLGCPVEVNIIDLEVNITDLEVNNTHI